MIKLDTAAAADKYVVSLDGGATYGAAVTITSEWQSIEINDKTIGLQVIKSTATIDTKAFEIYADQIRIWAMTELGIRLMMPNEYE